MLRPRIIPCLLIRDHGLVKTIKFGEGKYIGDPLNAVRIFNEKKADELTVLDIDATAQNRPPNLKLIETIAAECRMPLCYGGGIKTVEQARAIIALGVEKVALSSAAVQNPDLVTRLVDQVGSQSVVVILDVKKNSQTESYEVRVHNGKTGTGRSIAEVATSMEKCGVGEIVINSIDRDGEMKGYDMALARLVRQVTSVPMTILGGAGSVKHIEELIQEFGIIGACAGSLFVFKGPYKAVLINYPSLEERNRMVNRVVHMKDLR